MRKQLEHVLSNINVRACLKWLHFQKQKNQLWLRSCLASNSHPEEKVGKIKRKLPLYLSTSVSAATFIMGSQRPTEIRTKMGIYQLINL